MKTNQDALALNALTRRTFLRGAAGAAGAAFAATLPIPARAHGPITPIARRPKVAALITEFRPHSHSHVILENFLRSYLFNGEATDPGVDLVSFYVDQFPQHDMARATAREFNIPIYDTIAGALCLGGEQLAVDAVLAIAEHGTYDNDALGRHMYPRKRFFDETIAVFERSNRVAPYFNDKHLSYDWAESKAMYDTALRLGVPLMAGSSVPLAQREPMIDMPHDAVVEQAVSIHGGGVEWNDMHALEVLQSFVEFRRGGETGVRSVRFLQGDEIWQSAQRGEWSPELAEAAMAPEITRKWPDLQPLPPLREIVKLPQLVPVEPHAILLEYRDVLRAFILRVGDSGERFNLACRITGRAEPLATAINTGPWYNRNLFKALSHAIQHHFRERQAPYPVERTLLVSGILDAMMRSRNQNSQTLETPHLQIPYQPRDFTAFRETGASWKILTEATPEPEGLSPAAETYLNPPKP